VPVSARRQQTNLLHRTPHQAICCGSSLLAGRRHYPPPPLWRQNRSRPGHFRSFGSGLFPYLLPTLRCLDLDAAFILAFRARNFPAPGIVDRHQRQHTLIARFFSICGGIGRRFAHPSYWDDLQSPEYGPPQPSDVRMAIRLGSRSMGEYNTSRSKTAQLRACSPRRFFLDMHFCRKPTASSSLPVTAGREGPCIRPRQRVMCHKCAWRRESILMAMVALMPSARFSRRSRSARCDCRHDQVHAGRRPSRPNARASTDSIAPFVLPRPEALSVEVPALRPDRASVERTTSLFLL